MRTIYIKGIIINTWWCRASARAPFSLTINTRLYRCREKRSGRDDCWIRWRALSLPGICGTRARGKKNATREGGEMLHSHRVVEGALLCVWLISTALLALSLSFSLALASSGFWYGGHVLRWCFKSSDTWRAFCLSASGRLPGDAEKRRKRRGGDWPSWETDKRERGRANERKIKMSIYKSSDKKTREKEAEGREKERK